MSGSQLYRIGQLSKLSGISSRTIDYYTSIGLITPVKRASNKYRLYSNETLMRLERIETLKRDKYTLDEIKEILKQWAKVTTENQLTLKLSEIQQHLAKLEREVKELEPVLDQLKPKQAKHLYTRLLPQTAACMEAVMLLLNKNSLM